MFRSFITLAAVAGLVAGASAQQQLPVQKVSNLQYGTYDFQNGFQKSAGSNRAGGPDVLASNLACAAYYYGYIGAPFTLQEWVDEMPLADRGVRGEEEIRGITWEYCNTETLGYFDADVAIYNDTVAFTGPSAWIPATPSFADCLITVNLPDGGCWNVALDMSCGFECILPQFSNPNSGSQGTIGWSVTPYTLATFHGPILGVNTGCQIPGTQDLFEWRDQNGLYCPPAYTHCGTYWFGGGAKLRGDFRVEVVGNAEDSQSSYGSNGLDVLCARAQVNAEPASPFSVEVSGADATAKRYILLISPGAPVGATMTNANGSWTRWFSATPPNPRVILPGIFTGPVFKMGLTIPGAAPANARIQVQVVRTATAAAGVDQVTNGIDTYL
jgi:hypothetical protein